MTVTITLEDHRNKSLRNKTPFRVKKLVNTTLYGIGQFLSVEDVDRLINQGNKVVIVEAPKR